MHFVQAKSLLSGSNGMNLYRGCLHGWFTDFCQSYGILSNVNAIFADMEIMPERYEQFDMFT